MLPTPTSPRQTRPEAAASGLVCLGEVGVGNTTVAAALACALLDLEPQDAVGLGSGSDADMVARKREVVAAALTRTKGESDPLRLFAAVGGPVSYTHLRAHET